MSKIANLQIFIDRILQYGLKFILRWTSLLGVALVLDPCSCAFAYSTINKILFTDQKKKKAREINVFLPKSKWYIFSSSLNVYSLCK